MQQALDAKFAKYPAIAETLASTHPRKLIYECAEDSYWGIGHDAKGTIVLSSKSIYSYTVKPIFNGHV